MVSGTLGSIPGIRSEPVHPDGDVTFQSPGSPVDDVTDSAHNKMMDGCEPCGKILVSPRIYHGSSLVWWRGIGSFPLF